MEKAKFTRLNLNIALKDTSRKMLKMGWVLRFLKAGTLIKETMSMINLKEKVIII